MNERFRFRCTNIFVLSMLFHLSAPHCHPEFIKGTSSNWEGSNYVFEEDHSKLDPSIEQIFRGPIEKKEQATDVKENLDTENVVKPPLEPYREVEKRVRVKRENSAKKPNQKSLQESTKTEEKRSPKSNKRSSRSMRSSKDHQKLSNKQPTDYEVSSDQDASEYVDEVEEQPAVSSRNKEAGYKNSEFHVGEDSEKFIDQEERSSLYDDFETKEVAKRGISGSEDYEELDEESLEPEEDSAIEEQESSDDETEKKKIHGDTRVKREHSGPKDSFTATKPEDSGAQGDSTSDGRSPEACLKKDGTSETQASKANEENLKRSASDKQIESKINSDQLSDVSKQSSAVNDQIEAKNSENSKTLGTESQEASVEGKVQEEVNVLGNNKVANAVIGEFSNLKGSSKVEESNPMKADSASETSANKDVAKLESLKNSDAIAMDQDGDYEKRVEEQIQKKIDAIKEEIKREIEQKRRIREIEENNAKFDELHEQEIEDEDQVSESERSERRENSAKRSARNSGKSKRNESAEKELTKRKKRQDDAENKKSSRESVKKRSSLTPILREMPLQKRNTPREVFLIRNERNAGKKRRRRSKNAILIPEQRSIKLEDSLPADLTLDSSLRDSIDGGKVEEKTAAEQGSQSEKSDLVASLTGNEGSGPLATEYGDAFGGLHGEPGMALARFKRIKRVLRPPLNT